MLSHLANASQAHDHLVEFYESDRFLVDTIVNFLAPALAADDAAIVVATDAHRLQVQTAFATAGVDVERAAWGSRLVLLDADEMLAAFMVDDRPDPDRFREVVGGVIDAATAGGRKARIFGEMVAVLWEAGNVQGAIALEDLWNDLLGSRSFGLLCGYPASAFARPEDTPGFHAVCARHAAVIPTESYWSLTDADDRLRAVAMLQQQQRAGANERAAMRDKQQELESALERLREADRIRNEFVAMVAHDLRSPTAILTALLDVLRTSWPEMTEEEIGECLGTAITSARQIDRLTGDILTMARLESGSFSYILRPMDLAATAAEIVRQVRETSGRAITLTSARDLPMALADTDRQAQILHNLLSNAVKFSPDDAAIDVEVEADGDHLVVSVDDAGDGIAAADLERLFRPFSRLAGPGDRVAAGTGLGLYITKALVEGQGGTIAVTSTPGRGSRFTYTVPVAEA